MSHVKGLFQVNAWQTTHTQLSLLVPDSSVKLSLCSVAIAVWLDDISLLSACGTSTCVNVIATCSGFPQDGAVLKMHWVNVKKLAGEGGGENVEREKGRNSE